MALSRLGSVVVLVRREDCVPWVLAGALVMAMAACKRRDEPGACDGGAPQAADSSGAIASTAPPGPRGLDMDVPSASHRYRGAAWKACAEGFRISGEPVRDVERLALLCGPRHGFRRNGETWLGVVKPDRSEVLRLEAKRGQCVRVFATADHAVGLQVRLTSPHGDVLGMVETQDAHVTAPEDSALCLPSHGLHGIELRSMRAEARVAVQVWILP